MIKVSKNRTKLRIILLPVTLIILAGLIKYFGLVINVTPSVKTGLYIESVGKASRGDIALVCLKDPYKKTALVRNYVGTGRTCSGAEPLIKEVIAEPGDDVILAERLIQVNHNKYFFPVRHFDSLNRLLIIYPNGKYLHTHGYWLIGTNDKKSWDSRYFGPVGEDQIIKKLRPFIVW